MNQQIILYVDDEPDALKSIGYGLNEKGYRVLTAKSGSEALEIVKKDVPDLIIADLRMQPMNGFDFFQEIRKNSKFKNTPFFFLTAVNDPLAQKYGQKLGVDAYITKPVDLDDLVGAISNKLAGK